MAKKYVVAENASDKQVENIETMERISRDDLVEKLREFSSVGDPALLDESDSKVAEAERLRGIWEKQSDDEAKDENSAHRHELEKTMLFVDAGFHDLSYLGDVLEWLGQDAQNIEKDVTNTDTVNLRNDIAQAMKKIRGLGAQ